MVADGHVLVAQRPGCHSDVLYGASAVAPARMDVEVALDVGPRYEVREGVAGRRLHLPVALPELRRDVIEPQRPVQLLFAGELFSLQGDRVHEALSAEAYAPAGRVLDQPLEVLFRASVEQKAQAPVRRVGDAEGGLDAVS